MTVMVLYKNVHIVNYEENEIIPKDVTDDLNGYIISLVKSIEESNRLQYYKTEDETKQVINNIISIVRNLEEGKTENIPNQMKSIAKRLLDKEVEVQKKIERLNTNVKKGSLLQTIFFDSSKEEYNYLLTKTEHTKYMEETEFSVQSGFKIDEKNLWKSCLVQIIKDDNNLRIGDIRVYLDNSATYWHKDFLELDPIREDQQNTKQLFSNIERLLKKNVYSESKHDYIVLRNSLINYIRSKEQIDYYNLIEDIFENYKCEDIDIKIKDKFINDLRELPNKNKFDIQFSADPSALNVRVIKQTYELTDDIELIIKDTTGIDNITSDEDNFGNKYIKIKTNNMDAYETFLSK